jgi:hypothetical protein
MRLILLRELVGLVVPGSSAMELDEDWEVSGGRSCRFTELPVTGQNAGLSAERRDGNVEDHSAHFSNRFAHWGTPCLATQQGVGIPSNRWTGIGHFDRACAYVIWSHLTGVRASKRSVQVLLRAGAW